MRRRLLFVTVCLTHFFIGSAIAADRLKLTPSEAERGDDPRDATALIDVRLDDISRTQFTAWTTRHIGKMINIRIDGEVVCRPRLLTALTGGVLRIPGVAAGEIDTVAAKLLDGRANLEVEVDE